VRKVLRFINEHSDVTVEERWLLYCTRYNPKARLEVLLNRDAEVTHALHPGAFSWQGPDRLQPVPYQSSPRGRASAVERQRRVAGSDLPWYQIRVLGIDLQ
jgi:hypothetical protein